MITAPARSTRPLPSLVLIGLGFIVPLTYLSLLTWRFRIVPSSYLHMLTLYVDQWLPFTILLWVAAGWTWPGGRARVLALVIFGVGTLLSVISWVVFRSLLWN
jgi:hypothetical protein